MTEVVGKLVFVADVDHEITAAAASGAATADAADVAL